jgi:hypothetical protein
MSEDGNEPFASEEDFQAGLYELARAWAAYTSASGPAASAPLFSECTALLDRLAFTLEVVSAAASTRGSHPRLVHGRLNGSVRGPLLPDAMVAVCATPPPLLHDQ